MFYEKVTTITTSTFTITCLVQTKTGETDVTISLSVDNSMSLIMQTFNFVKGQFIAKRPSYHRALRAKAVFDLLQNCLGAEIIFVKPGCEIRSEELISALQKFEMFLINRVKSDSTRYIYSCAIRQYLSNVNVLLQDGRTTRDEIKTFNSLFKKPKNGNFGVNIGGISTIEHNDFKFLQSQALEKISSSLDAIENFCGIIIDDYLSVVDDHKALKDFSFSSEIYDYYTNRLKKSDPWSKDFKPPQGANGRSLLAFIIQSTTQETFGSGITLPGLCHLPDVLNDKLIWQTQNSFFSFFFAEFFLSNHILIAIAVLICQKTGWNPGSVHALSKGDIQKLSPTRYQFQSSKRKTDDRTPAYELRRSSEPLLFKAIELLLWHHKQVTKIYALTEPRLFIGAYNAGFAIFYPLNRSNLLNKFIIPSGLPNFSAKDLRTTRAGLTMLTTKDIQVVRELLGHESISTTQAYLANTLFFQLNESRILEFQRRIEATLTFLDGGDELVISRNFKARHVDTALFEAEHVGDGTRCLNPRDSPDPNTRIGEQCAGLHCHINGGCKNNLFQVDRTDVELAQKTRAYYQSRWSHLFEKNPKNFAEIHVPKIIFILVFLAHVKQVRPNLINP